jgi:hypothetical protein
VTDNIAVHLRITGLTPSNDDVNSRKAAATSLAAAWGKIKDIPGIIQKSSAIAESLGGDGVPSEGLGNEVQAAVQKHASAFLYSESPLEVGICAGMAAVSIMKPEPGPSGWQIVDIYTNALWSALSFQPLLEEEKRENLRGEVLERARLRSIDSAEKARERITVSDPLDLVVSIDDQKRVTTNFKKATLDTIEALRRNAALDREEIDFLWWSQLGRSRLLNRPLATIAEGCRLVASGIEAASHLRRFPAHVHRDLVLRTADKDPELNLPELLAAIDGDRAALAEGIGSQAVTEYPVVFPLLNAIVTGATDALGGQQKRKASDWGARALLEGSLARFWNSGLPQK